METSIGEDVADEISRQGYRAILAGTGRFVGEFLSNVGFVVINDPFSFMEGLRYKDVIMSDSAAQIMSNVNSKEINRIFPSETLSGRLIDTNILSQANGIRGGVSKGFIRNKAEQVWNLTGKKYKNAVELTSDVLISTPDKIIMRPFWFGSFASKFEEITGKKIDFEKIANNDEAYMDANKEAIEEAKEELKGEKNASFVEDKVNEAIKCLNQAKRNFKSPKNPSTIVYNMDKILSLTNELRIKVLEDKK
jgi:hypothetical protein